MNSVGTKASATFYAIQVSPGEYWSKCSTILIFRLFPLDIQRWTSQILQLFCQLRWAFVKAQSSRVLTIWIEFVEEFLLYVRVPLLIQFNLYPIPNLLIISRIQYTLQSILCTRLLLHLHESSFAIQDDLTMLSLSHIEFASSRTGPTPVISESGGA